jgi:hypothetical protein
MLFSLLTILYLIEISHKQSPPQDQINMGGILVLAGS